MQDNILEMRGITKEFPGVKALDNVTFQVKRGEIKALVGENGAGKSTLMNVLSGIYPYGSYTGDIVVNGEVCRFKGIAQSEAAGIAIIHQELAMIPQLSIAENVFIGKSLSKNGIIDWNKIRAATIPLLERVGLHEDPDTPINNGVKDVPASTYDPYLIDKDNVQYLVDVGFYTDAEVNG